MGVDRPFRCVPSHPHPPKLKEVPDTVLRVDKNQKLELKHPWVLLFVGYEYPLDSALIKPTQGRWLNLQAVILHMF